MERDHRTSRQPIGVTERAQSVLDFAIGVSLFLVVVIGVLVFLPTGFGGLNDGGGISPSDQLAADRAADYLAGDGFGDPDTPNKFNHFCLVTFFDDGTACGFEAGTPPAQEVSFGPTRPVNITVEADINDDDALEQLCWNGDAPANVSDTDNFWVTPGKDECDVPFRTETSAASNVEYASATRVGTFRVLRLGPPGSDRTMVYVTVRTW